MSVSGSNADITNIGLLTYNYSERGSSGVSKIFEKSYYSEYTYTGGSTSFDVAEIQMSTSIGGVRGAGMVEVVIAGTHPPAGSSITIRGMRRVIIAFLYESGSLSSSVFVNDNFDDDTTNIPTVSLVYTGGTTGRSTAAIRTSFTDSASTLILRQATHVKLYTGSMAGPDVSWDLT